MPKRRPEQSRIESAALATLARRQHGVVSVRQLYSVGVSDRQLRRLVTAGWLHPVMRGVYAVGYRPLTRRGEWMAALLAVGPGAVLSHRAAASVWGIWGEGDRRIVDVILPRRHGRKRRAGIRIHRPQVLPPDELTERDGFPVTSAARTVLDLATVLRGRRLERALDQAVRFCTAEEILAVAGLTRRPGSRRLLAALGAHEAGSTATRSELEERFLLVCRGHGLPQPEVNVPVLEYVVDFLWRGARLIVEVDGLATHGTRGAFEADRDRDGALTVAGYRVVRFTWRDLTSRPRVVADRVRRLLNPR